MPKINSQDNFKLIAQDLIQALKRYKGNDIIATPQQSTALRQLANIFNTITSQNTDTPQRMTIQNLNTTDATSKEHIQGQPRIHLRHTRANTPHQQSDTMQNNAATPQRVKKTKRERKNNHTRQPSKAKQHTATAHIPTKIKLLYNKKCSLNITQCHVSCNEKQSTKPTHHTYMYTKTTSV